MRRAAALLIAATLALGAAEDTQEDLRRLRDALSMNLPDPVPVLFCRYLRDENGVMLEQTSDIRKVDLLWFCRRCKGITPPMVAEYAAQGFISEEENLVRYDL